MEEAGGKIGSGREGVEGERLRSNSYSISLAIVIAYTSYYF